MVVEQFNDFNYNIDFMKDSGRIGKIIRCCWFLMIILITVLAGVFNHSVGIGGQSAGRDLKTAFAFSFYEIGSHLKKSPDNYERHFVFRNILIYLNNWLTVKIFNISPVKSVILGKDDWLFQAKENLLPHEPAYFSSIQPFTFNEMEKWRIALEQRQRWLEKRDILYVFIPVPDKSTIYPEFLPDHIQAFYSRSRLDQLIQHLKRFSAVNVLDLRSALLKFKKDFLLYHKTDSHWNDYGIFFSTGEIIAFLASHFPNKKMNPMKVSDFRIRKTGKGDGNLARMLFLKDKRFREKRIRLRKKTPKPWYITRIPPSIRISKDLRPLVTENQRADLAKAIMFHDSSGIGLRPFLSENFGRIFYIRDWDFRFWTRIIDHEKPDVVLDEISEHFLYNRLLINPKHISETNSRPDET